MPPGFQGWHRPMRRIASQPPRTSPCTARASWAYAEQDGWNRQCAPRSGDTKRRYTPMNLINPAGTTSLTLIPTHRWIWPAAEHPALAPRAPRAIAGSSPGGRRARRTPPPPPSSAPQRRSQPAQSSAGAPATLRGSGASSGSVRRPCPRHAKRPGQAEPAPVLLAAPKGPHLHPHTRAPPNLRLPGYGPRAAHAGIPGGPSACPGTHAAVARLGLRRETCPPFVPATRDHCPARPCPHPDPESVGLLAVACVWLKSSLHGSPRDSPAGTGRSHRSTSQCPDCLPTRLPTLTPSSRSVGPPRADLRALVGRRVPCI